MLIVYTTILAQFIKLTLFFSMKSKVRLLASAMCLYHECKASSLTLSGRVLEEFEKKGALSQKLTQ